MKTEHQQNPSTKAQRAGRGQLGPTFGVDLSHTAKNLELTQMVPTIFPRTQTSQELPAEGSRLGPVPSEPHVAPATQGLSTPEK